MNYLITKKDFIAVHTKFLLTIASMLILFFTASNSFGMSGGGGGGLVCGDNGYTSMPNGTQAQDPTTLCVGGGPFSYLEAMPKAEAAAEKAVELDPDNPRAKQMLERLRSAE